jgi:anti-anti-sigma regulatory factor
MADSGFSIALRNCAGIPVVELVGEINKKTIATLNDILGKLIRAGHYNVMLNLKRADWQRSATLESLKKIAKMFQVHYGHVDVIAEKEQISGLSKLRLDSLFRFCTSEGQALIRIKKLPPQSAMGIVPMPARLSDK